MMTQLRADKEYPLILHNHQSCQLLSYLGPIHTDETLSGAYQRLCNNILSSDIGDITIRGPYVERQSRILTLIDNYIVGLYKSENNQYKICKDLVQYVKYCLDKVLGVASRNRLSDALRT